MVHELIPGIRKLIAEMTAAMYDVLRKRVAGMDRRSAEAARVEDRDLLQTWLTTSGGRDHPAYWVLGYLSSPGLAASVRRPPTKPKPKQPRPSAILFDAPDGWVVRPGAWRLT